VNLPDVVEQSDPFHVVLRVLVQVRGFGEHERVAGDAPHVRASLRVGGVDRVEQSLEEGRGETLRGVGVPDRLAAEARCAGAGCWFERVSIVRRCWARIVRHRARR
jgi:hypothetical protein